MFIQILQELYDGGADFVDISGNSPEEGEPLRDTIKITVKPEYMTEDLPENIEEHIDLNSDRSLSDEDINDLI
jgi:hypothetical protein